MERLAHLTSCLEPQITAHRRSLLSFSSLSVAELIAQHKACDAATQKGPYPYTRARRVKRLVISPSMRPPPPPPPGGPTVIVLGQSLDATPSAAGVRVGVSPFDNTCSTAARYTGAMCCAAHPRTEPPPATPTSTTSSTHGVTMHAVRLEGFLL